MTTAALACRCGTPATGYVPSLLGAEPLCTYCGALHVVQAAAPSLVARPVLFLAAGPLAPGEDPDVLGGALGERLAALVGLPVATFRERADGFHVLSRTPPIHREESADMVRRAHAALEGRRAVLLGADTAALLQVGVRALQAVLLQGRGETRTALVTLPKPTPRVLGSSRTVADAVPLLRAFFDLPAQARGCVRRGCGWPRLPDALVCGRHRSRA